jgi:hypothetical protein
MYEDYAYIPLDVPAPPVDITELQRFVQSRCEQCAFTDNRIRWVLYHARKPVFDHEPLLYAQDPRFEQLTPDTRFVWDPCFGRSFRALAEWFETLPFTNLQGLTLTTQTDHIRDHMDIFGHNNSASYYEHHRDMEPCYYRMILCHSDDEISRKRSFYVTQEYGGAKRYVNLPDDTSLIALSSSCCYHGATHNPGHYKTTAVLYGDLDRGAHLELLKRSLDRYGDYALRLDRPGPVSGPGAVLPYAGAE